MDKFWSINGQGNNFKYYLAEEVDAEIAELKASKKEAILSAHLAGQADAGVDPSYSNAQCYLNKVEKSDG